MATFDNCVSLEIFDNIFDGGKDTAIVAVGQIAMGDLGEVSKRARGLHL